MPRRTPGSIRTPDAPRPDELERQVDADLSGQTLRGWGLTDVVLERGNLANLVAPEATLRRVTVTGARMTGVQWTRGTVADVVFRDCRIDLATFAGLRIDGCELRSCTLDGLAGAERLRGAAMPWGDIVGHAGLFASTLGIRLIEDR